MVDTASPQIEINWGGRHRQARIDIVENGYKIRAEFPMPGAPSRQYVFMAASEVTSWVDWYFNVSDDELLDGTPPTVR
jgi:glutamine synthetase